MSEEFSATKQADETIALILQYQTNIFKEQFPNGQSASDVAGFIETLRNRLIDMYNLKPSI